MFVMVLMLITKPHFLDGKNPSNKTGGSGGIQMDIYFLLTLRDSCISLV